MSGFTQELQYLASLPADQPQSLPGRFYTSEDRFDHEARSVLRAGWHCVGRADEIPKPGDYFTVQLLHEPLIIVRSETGDILGLANVCRHRGMPLAEGRGTAKRFVCSYHAWTYDLDGALLRAARMKNTGFDPSRCGLHQHNLYQWNGFIYVNLCAHAAPFQAPPLDALLAPYAPQEFHLVHVAEEIWHTNWKSLVENFMEGYHLSVVHPKTLHDYTPTGMARKLVSGDGFTSYGANYPQGIASRGRGAPGLPEDARSRSTLFALFPTQVASQAASLLVSLMLFPLSAGRTQLKWTMSAYADDLDAQTISARIALWEDVNREDREKLERLQIALGSEHAQSGPLAEDDYEGTIRDFQIWLAQHDQPNAI